MSISMKTLILNKTRSTAFLLGVMACSSLAIADELADKYFSGENPKLTAQERTAIELSKKWSAGNPAGIKPVAGSGGAVHFIYGVQQPSIVCAVLQVCDISLQAGEQVNSINLGDTARWTVEPAITGNGSTAVQHLIIKPMDVGLETSLVVTTDRRAYHIRLRSHRKDYMPQVAFTYPEEALAKWELIQKQEKHERQEKTLPKTGEYLGDLSFEYDLQGDSKWKPVRVYNDGVKTIIEMPKVIEQTEAPSLMLITRKGNWFRKEETQIVNYRLQGNRYIVDAVFDQAVLIAGVGKRQERVTIIRR